MSKKLKYLMTADEFMLMESLNEKIVTAKRKYGDHPSIEASTYAPVREKVLAFIAERGKVTEAELKEFFKLLAEEEGSKPKNYSMWIKHNRKFLVEGELDGEKIFKLSYAGNKLINMNNEI